jgi:tetratricopeptide (TPR) repeat protein
VRSALAVVILIGVAAAEPTDKSAADELFEQGRTLLARGEFDAACAKFEASLQKDPAGVGALLNLALCNERRGKIATAYALYERALEQATDAKLGKPQAEARKKVTELSARLPIVAISYAAPPIDGTKLVIDDAVVPLSAKERPLDPGRHEIVVTAPGRIPFQTAISIAIAERKSLVIPALELPKQQTIVKQGNARRAIGKAATLGGSGLVVGASLLALYAHHLYNEPFHGNPPDCGGPTHPDVDGKTACDQAGQDKTERARSLGTAATVVGGIGIAVAVTGAILWKTAAPKERTITPIATATTIGLAIGGGF